MSTVVDEYVRQVELACVDLPEEQRRRLIADLAAHLREVDTVAGSIYGELGPPDVYAAELRAALELPVSPAQYSPSRLHQFTAARGRPSTPVLVALGCVAALIVAVVVAVIVSSSGGASPPAAAPTLSASATAAPSPATVPVTLPDLVGRTNSDAAQALFALGLRVVEVPVHAPAAASGTVVRQQPVAGSVLPPGTVVTLETAG